MASPEFNPSKLMGYIVKRASWYSIEKPADSEDLRQEGLIAAWKATHSYDAARNVPYLSWAMQSIDYAMQEHRFRGTWTGMPPRSKNGGSSVKHFDVPVGLGNEDTSDRVAGRSASWILDKAVAGVLESSDWAYHEVEIVKAIASLKPDQQKYIYLRFWLGMRPAEIGPYFPNLADAASTLWYDRTYGARSKLKRALAHLAPA